jgi:hypothetical protein
MPLQDFVPTPRFEDYSEAFKDFFRMERRDDGVLLVKAHTLGGPVQLSVQNHRALGQMLKGRRRRPGQRGRHPHRLRRGVHDELGPAGVRPRRGGHGALGV